VDYFCKLSVSGLFISVINQLDAQNFCLTINLFLASTCAQVHETATYRCDDTRGCVMQFWPPVDEHMCSKHGEAWNKLIVKQKCCASSWLITEINILRCTVSKMSKFLCQVYPQINNMHLDLENVISTLVLYWFKFSENSLLQPHWILCDVYCVRPVDCVGKCWLL